MTNFWEPFAQDIRFTFRSMMGSKLFTGMAVLSLALGIGANTAIYSFMDGVMLRALPVRHPEQLVILNWRAKASTPVICQPLGIGLRRTWWRPDQSEFSLSGLRAPPGPQ